MPRKNPVRSSRPSRKAKKGPLAEENARLRRALAREKGRSRQLEEKLSVDSTRQEESAAALDAGRDQQVATAEILRLISSSPTDAQPVFDAIARNAVRLCGARGGVVVSYDGALLHLAAHHDVAPETVGRLESRYPEAPDRNTPLGHAVLDGAVVHVPDLQAAVEFSAALSRQAGGRGHVSVPLLREGRAIGAIGLTRLTAGPYSDQQIALLQTFAEQAVIAIENVRLFKELEARNRDLSEALEQQTATAEILRVISGSPTDLQPVLDAVSENASRLCEASDAVILLVEGDQLRTAAHHGQVFAVALDRPATRDSVPGRAVIDRETIHVPDVREADDFPLGQQLARADGSRTVLATPLMREGVAIGGILIRRGEVRPFSDKQVKLLQTFADQAVIAIENVRLFTELEARNRDLSEALDQQTATAEILRVISSSPTDVQPVFDTIVRSAVRLCDGLFSALFQFDGELIHQVAQHNYTPEALEAAHRVFPARPTRALLSGRAILERAVVHIPDVEVDPEFQNQALSRAIGFRSSLLVPMLRDGAPIGVINVTRAKPGPFSDNEIALLKTTPIRPSSPSRTCGCSGSCRTRTAR